MTQRNPLSKVERIAAWEQSRRQKLSERRTLTKKRLPKVRSRERHALPFE
jgi:hypothetical protein